MQNSTECLNAIDDFITQMDEGVLYDVVHHSHDELSKTSEKRTLETDSISCIWTPEEASQHPPGTGHSSVWRQGPAEEEQGGLSHPTPEAIFK